MSAYAKSRRRSSYTHTPQTWAEWRRVHPHTVIVEPVKQVHCTDSALWHLSDYAVSSASRDTVYLVPRAAGEDVPA
jgi:hypothetical protein